MQSFEDKNEDFKAVDDKLSWLAKETEEYLKKAIEECRSYEKKFRRADEESLFQAITPQLRKDEFCFHNFIVYYFLHSYQLAFSCLGAIDLLTDFEKKYFYEINVDYTDRFKSLCKTYKKIVKELTELREKASYLMSSCSTISFHPERVVKMWQFSKSNFLEKDFWNKEIQKYPLLDTYSVELEKDNPSIYVHEYINYDLSLLGVIVTYLERLAAIKDRRKEKAKEIWDYLVNEDENIHPIIESLKQDWEERKEDDEKEVLNKTNIELQDLLAKIKEGSWGNIWLVSGRNAESFIKNVIPNNCNNFNDFNRFVADVCYLEWLKKKKKEMMKKPKEEEISGNTYSQNKPGVKPSQLFRKDIDEDKMAAAIKDIYTKSFDARINMFIIGSDRSQYEIADALASTLFALEGLDLCNPPLSATAFLRFLNDKCNMNFNNQKGNLNNRIAKLKALTEPNYKPFCQLTNADFPPHPKVGAMKKKDFIKLRFPTDRILDSLEGMNFKKEGK